MQHAASKSILFVCLLVMASCCQAFVPPSVRSLGSGRVGIRVLPGRRLQASEGGGGEEGGKRELDRLFEEAEKANQRNSVMEGIKGTVDRLPLPKLGGSGAAPAPDPDRPFRFPAYGFLAISMLLGISFTGSLAELAGGKPILGPVGTLAVVVGAGPGFIGSFVYAVKRYNEEKEEDNARLEEEERREEAARQKALQGPVPLSALKDRE